MNNDYASLSNVQKLAANRAGVLTDEQRAELAKQARGGGCFLVGIVVIVLLALGAVLVVPTLLESGVVGKSEFAFGRLTCAFPLLLIGGGLIVLGFYAPFGIRRNFRRLRADLAAGQVVHGQGSVTYTPRGYFARMEWTQALPGEGAARWQRSRRVQLPPGRYYFYYLPQSGTLLSAEPVEGQPAPEASFFSQSTAPAPDPLAGLPGYSPARQPSGGYASAGDAGAALALSPQAADALRAALGAALHFTIADLAENRLGRLGAEQGRRLTRPSCFSAVFALVAIGGVATCALLGLSRVMPPVFILVFVGFLALVVLVILRLAVPPVVDARDRRVESIEGVVRGKSETSGEDTSYFYVLETMRFQVSYTAYVALVSGLRYRLYFTPRAKRVVGIEPLAS